MRRRASACRGRSRRRLDITPDIVRSASRHSRDDGAELLDLDDPAVLVQEELRPSRVATSDRATTQGQASELFQRHREVVGLRWWSTFESLWPNITLFDRAETALELSDVQRLEVGDDVVLEAAEFLGLSVST